VQAPAGKSIFNIAKELGIQIPHLCHQEGLTPDGNCRACVVEIDGERTLAPSCCRSATPGMQVRTHSERAVKSQQMVLEMLLADLPEQGHKWLDDRAEAPHGELSQWAEHCGVQVRPALAALRRESVPADLSHPAMAVNLDACIQCNRCQRACRDLQVNDVIGLAFRGAHTQVVFDLADPMGGSSCVGCGECVQACPTGALMPKSHMGPQTVDREVDSVCPFCGVGCLVTFQVRDPDPTGAVPARIVSVKGRAGPANEGRLCVKGRFGMDYIHSPDRITQPLIRKAGVAKDLGLIDGHTDWREVFREATWDEALHLATQPLNALRQQHGPKSLAGFGSAKGSNEEAYLFQKLVRTGFGSNNVDHCTRLCHASSVAALLEGVGSGAVSNPVRDVAHSDLILVIGANPTADLDEERRQTRHPHRAGRPAHHRHRASRLAQAAVQSRHRCGAAQCHAARHRHREPVRRALFARACRQCGCAQGPCAGLHA
jgi:formate dehydrogenase major subunit